MSIFRAYFLAFVTLDKVHLVTQQGTRLSALVIDDTSLLVGF